MKTEGLYDPSFEHDACGIGFVAHIKGRKSHQIIEDAIKMLTRMEHRGACGCEENTGDGAGILIQMPHEFFLDECTKLGFALPPYGEYGVGMVFFPQDAELKEECRTILDRKIKQLGLELIGYRKVPTNNEQIGESALAEEPVMEQVFIKLSPTISEPSDKDFFERKLFVLRNYATRVINESVQGVNNNFYFASLSYKTIIYKGQLTTGQVRPYFPDLHNENVVSALAVIHSRFSTNTFPSWKLAQPFRYIAHNGEINTVRGNVNWFQASETEFESEYFTKEELDMLRPICGLSQSDSANLDNVIEMLVLSGRSLPHVMMMLIPEAWDGNEQMEKMRKKFYEYHASLMAPWDGPASITFTDGKIVGATLDRNGLRPSRYCVTTDDRVIMASEAGVLDIDQSTIISKGRLQPGKMFIVDMEQGKILSDEEVKAKICAQQPYGDWLKENKIKIKEIVKPASRFVPLTNKSLIKRQIAAGYTSEDLKYIIGAMATSAKPSLGSMGLDTPLAILSEQSQHLTNYFKQLFAQVTNPPIDSIRERSVMSLISYVGIKQNLLTETAKHCHTLELPQPILNNDDLEKIRHIDNKGFQTKTIFTYFKADAKAGMLERGLDRICKYAEDAVEDGFSIIILSDRSSDSSHAQIPSLLAMSAVHHHLIKKGLRDNIGLITETGDAWESHHFATLIGYGASGVNPYLALETIAYQKRKGMLDTDLTEKELQKNYIKAVGKELLKIFAKMGISTLQSYQGAQIFEALGIDKEVIDKYFTGTVSRIGGLKLDDIAREVLVRHQMAYPVQPAPKLRLEVGGIYQWKQRGEEHIFNPQTIHLLQESTKREDYQLFKKYTRLIDNQTEKALTLRGMLKFKSAKPIPIEEVEPAENIFKRFATGAMSFGSISWEAHTTLAIAMNRIGGKSNSGEGGEDPKRYETLENGDSMNSSIKQVASGRFGVNSYYLSNATEIQIKMAQGAKPGEGGQLPGHKVDDWIAKVRYSTPGVGLISPPPHHDIYSIEDLAQLIFDLKNANRHARINVKLVSEAGVGTIAAGVAKAHADVVLISGHDGGTGASPLSSIRHAGLPWELGVAETHQTLVKNKLRSRITVQADGQIRTGKDLAVAALLGAEEWGVATAALVSTGCIMMRKCHLNTCPVGVATQRKELRSLFTGKPEYVVNLFKFLAEELREIMAEMGFRTVDEMIGQSDRLAIRDNITHWKHQNLDLSKILYKAPASSEVGLFKQEEQDHGIDNVLDWKILEKVKPSIENLQPIKVDFKIQNTDRAVGALLSHEISKKYGLQELPQNTLHLKFKGTAGQSFAAFAVKGITMEIEGDANDYVGKGLSGAKLIFYPDHKAKFVPAENSIISNVAFYGATSGEAYIRGMAGERFAVRNSGVKTVVEGIGDHGCEYMTGGLVINLGDTGRNFAAGMSGGVAYIWNKKGNFEEKLNSEMVEIEQLTIEDENIIRMYVENHLHYTESLLAKEILNDWENSIVHFIKIMPIDFKRALLDRNITLLQKLDDELVVSE